MRYITQAGLEKGMLLARNLYDAQCKKVFFDGQKLSNKDVEKIKKAGYPGAYILDPCADEIVAEPVLSEELYYHTVSEVSYILQSVREDTSSTYIVTREEQLAIIEPVLDALYHRQDQLVDYIDTRPYDGYDDFHAVMAMILGLRVGMKMGLTREQLIELAIAALFHDVGTIFLSSDILNRPGKLTDEEFNMIKEHVQKGAEYLERNFALTPPITQAIMQHHENYDGTGYPNGLRRKNISLYGRIIAICDVFDALVSKRAFRAAMYPVAAIEVLAQQADRKFDPDIVETLDSILAPFPTGCLARLKTGEVCVVAYNYPEAPKRPLLEAYNGRRATQVFYDLHKDPQYSGAVVAKILDSMP